MSERPRGAVQYDNRGRVVLITGGCGGIGVALCESFASSGAIVVAVDVMAQATAELPAGVHYFQADVADPAQCQAAVQWTIDQFSALDVLVNNAAIQPPASYTAQHRVPVELWEKMVAVNFSGYAWMAAAALPTMLKQRSGVIINMASAQGHRTAREVPIYGPIKAANIMQARQWGIEYARDGIRVVSLSPGAIETPLLRASLDLQGGPGALANRHPIGRLGQPEEVARAALWLASSDASFVVATDLAVDGGLGAFGAFADPFEPQQPRDLS